jgi:hypothetical protein
MGNLDIFLTSAHNGAGSGSYVAQLPHSGRESPGFEPRFDAWSRDYAVDIFRPNPTLPMLIFANAKTPLSELQVPLASSSCQCSDSESVRSTVTGPGHTAANHEPMVGAA